MMKNIFFLLLINAISISAQTPCSNGMAGEYPCKGYDLLARVPVSVLANTNGNPEGSDIWGWTDITTGKEYAIVATTNSTAFVDISNPTSPVFLGRLDSSAGNNYWRDVKVYKNHAFIVADGVGNHGMQIFDLKKLRTATSSTIHTEDKIYKGVGSCHNIFINQDTGIAYLVGCANYSGGPVFIDISNPTNPVDLGGYAAGGYTHDAQIVKYKGPDARYTDREIFIGSNEDEIVILDVTNKNDVKRVGAIAYAQIGYTHQGWFTEDQRYFILGDETDEINHGMNTRTLIFDLLDLEKPKLSSTYYGQSKAIDHNGYVKGDEFFMANYRAGVRIFDISNIAATINSMTEIAYFDTYPDNDFTAFNGAWSSYPYFASENIIISDVERGLFIIRKSGTLSTNENTYTDPFSIFPNPVSTEATISTSNGELIENIKIYTILGQKIFDKKNINQEEYVLAKNNYEKGVYIININSTTTKKIIIN